MKRIRTDRICLLTGYHDLNMMSSVPFYVAVLMVKVSECPYKARVRGLLEKDTVLPHEKASRVFP
jgi:hypothetical protein